MSQFASVATVPSDNSFIDPLLHITVLEGHADVTISVNVHAVNLEEFLKNFIEQAALRPGDNLHRKRSRLQYRRTNCFR
jgi:hypothetical protein